MDGETWTSMAPAPPDPKKNDDEGIALTTVVTTADAAVAPVAAATPAEAQAQVQAEKIEARGGWLKMCIFAAILVTVLSLLLMLTATEKKNSSISLSAEGHAPSYEDQFSDHNHHDSWHDDHHLDYYGYQDYHSDQHVDHSHDQSHDHSHDQLQQLPADIPHDASHDGPHDQHDSRLISLLQTVNNSTGNMSAAELANLTSAIQQAHADDMHSHQEEDHARHELMDALQHDELVHMGVTHGESEHHEQHQDGEHRDQQHYDDQHHGEQYHDSEHGAESQQHYGDEQPGHDDAEHAQQDDDRSDYDDVEGDSRGYANDEFGGESLETKVLMPQQATTEVDSYLCTTVPVDSTRPLKLTGFDPIAEMGTVHHMLLFGCVKPASTAAVWPCKMEPVCAADGGESVLYGWGRNAPRINLPSGVGFSTGPGTGISSIVLQVHYLEPRPANDTSGVVLHFRSEPMPRSAGVIAFAADFKVPPRTDKYLVPTACCYRGIETLVGFAFRVHTHALGQSVFLESSSLAPSRSTPHRIAEQSPQQPQGFYAVDGHAVSIRNGDWLRATCQFNSSQTDVETPVGHGATNEMCNLYLMVHAELPYFSWCAMPEGEMIVDPIGAGGLPSKGTANIETAHWHTLNYFEHNSIEVPVKQVSGLATVVGQYDDPAIWVFHRGARIWNGTTFDARTHVMTDAPLATPSLLQVHRDSGALMDGSEFGLPSAAFPGFLMSHFVSSSLDGTAVWVVDAGTHQVYRFDASGAADRAPTLTIGARGVAGDESTNAAAGATELDAASVRLCQPTHAVESRDGRLFISDGYCHSRIVVLDLTTKKVSAVWPLSTAAGKAPLPHALLVGECERKLYVADREAARIAVMDLETGKESASWNLEAHGLPYSIRAGPYGDVLVLVWDRDRSGKSALLALDPSNGAVRSVYDLPDARSPHDFVVMPAPLELSGAGERRLAVVVAETHDPNMSPTSSQAGPEDAMKKYVLMPSGDAHLTMAHNANTNIHHG